MPRGKKNEEIEEKTDGQTPSSEQTQPKEEPRRLNLKTIKVKGNDYVTVAERIIAFHDLFPNGMIQSYILSNINDPYIVVQARIWEDADKPQQYYTGHSQAVKGEGHVNKTSALENAETSAIGRALGIMGIGLLEGLASADEMVKAGFKQDETPSTPQREEAPRPPMGEANYSLIEDEGERASALLIAEEIKAAADVESIKKIATESKEIEFSAIAKEQLRLEANKKIKQINTKGK